VLFEQSSSFVQEDILIKQVLLFALAAVSVTRVGVAASCKPGDLTSYVTLGAVGCTIGNNKLSDFKLLGGTAGATEIAAGLVNITPSGGNFNPSLALSVTETAPVGALLETMFTYDISGQSYIGTSALLSGSSVTLDGAVTGIENYCTAGAFGPDGVDGCTGGNGSLTTLALLPASDSQLSDTNSFAKVPFINVTNDLLLEGGIAGGTATGGTFTDSFAAVPEPASLALLGFGLVFAATYRKRSKLSKQETK
jgi:hypothetical protein